MCVYGWIVILVCACANVWQNINAQLNWILIGAHSIRCEYTPKSNFFYYFFWFNLLRPPALSLSLPYFSVRILALPLYPRQSLVFVLFCCQHSICSQIRLDCVYFFGYSHSLFSLLLLFAVYFCLTVCVCVHALLFPSFGSNSVSLTLFLQNDE